MKIVKRLLIFLLCIVMAGGILFLISIPRVNDHIAKHTMTELAQVPMPEQTKCIEKVSAAGKLSGNGNGMQYLGALLVKSNLSLKDLKKYYAANTPRKWYCDVPVNMWTWTLSIRSRGRIITLFMPGETMMEYIVN